MVIEMTKHPQTYIRHSTVPLEVGFAAIRAAVEVLDNGCNKPPKSVINGIELNTYSTRLQTFLKHGISCSCCNLTAVHWAIERFPNTQSWHLNLWATDASGYEVLMTHDHTVARALGGADNLSNTTTMCSPCNSKKAQGEHQEAHRRKQLATERARAEKIAAHA